MVMSMNVSTIFGKKRDFPTQVKVAMERLQTEADKDPLSFKGNVENLEKEWGGRTDAVERSVIHALLGSSYREMIYSGAADFDEEAQKDFRSKSQTHFKQVLDNMELLAGTPSAPYAPLLVKGSDSELYGSDMLSVLVSFLVRYADFHDYEDAELYGRARDVYRKRGNINGYGLMAMERLELLRDVDKVHGHLSPAQYSDSLYQLVQEVKGEEIAGDVALAYVESLDEGDNSDRQITFLQWALKNLAKSKQTGQLKSRLADLTRPTIESPKDVDAVPGKPARGRVWLQNCERVTITVRQYVGRKYSKDGRGELLLTGAVVAQTEAVLPIDSVNAARKAKGLPVQGTADWELTLPAGHYVLVAECIGEKAVREMDVVSLRTVFVDKDKETLRVYVVDSETGRPLPGVKVQCRKKLPEATERRPGWEDSDVEMELTTDATGAVDVKKTYWVRAIKDDINRTRWTNGHYYWGNKPKQRRVERLSVSTDRSLYRPGQEVQGTVIAYTQSGDTTRVLAEETLTLVARDAQGHELTRQEQKTSALGSAAFSFLLPADCAVGTLSLVAESPSGEKCWQSARVEEYKRPTFEVKMTGKKTGKFGQTVDVVGTAKMFAGVPVQNAAVHYSVECAPATFYDWWWRPLSWTDLAEGELKTDDDGSFRVPVELIDDYLTDEERVMRFRVMATVTDLSGESHECQWSFNVSRWEGAADVRVDEVVDLSKQATFKVNTFDANHEDVDVNGTYQIRHGEKVVVEGEFASCTDIPLPKQLQLGVRYDLLAFLTSQEGVSREVGRASFTAYSSALPVTDFVKMGTKESCRTESDVEETDFFYSAQDSFAEGGALDCYFSTQETDAYVIYNVYNADGLLESHAAVTDGALKHIRLSYRKEWGEGISVNMAYVRNGHFASFTRNFTLAEPEKKLKLEWATFRDKLQPGQPERWTLTVTDKAGRRVSGAEMAAVLYDASLDRIYPHQWSFQLGYNRFVPNVRWDAFAQSYVPAFSIYAPTENYDFYYRTFDQLRPFEHDRYRNSRVMRLSEVAVGSQKAVTASMMAAPPAAMMEVADEDSAEESAIAYSADRGEDAPVAVRENFAETAFFLPQLVTDAQGHVNIQFTLPESLTEWRFMGFAHTREMDYGMLTDTIVAQKMLMLRPNMPRFVRWGDKAVVASSVVNQGDDALVGTVSMRLLDAKTGEVLLSEEKPFAVDAGKSVAVSFSFDVSSAWTDLDCELVAVSGHVSDGEKNHLPVLSTRQTIVEAVPFYIMGNADGSVSEKSVDLSQLFNHHSSTATQRKLKVEYTDNPVWMCIESLRSVKNPESDDAICYAVSLYANTRLAELMQTFPVLEKHENREELLLRAAEAEKKLAALQDSTGGWSWFEGMSPNFYVTMAVCEHMAQLPLPSQAVKEMLRHGMDFLDRHELKTFAERQKVTKKVWASDADFRYLYLSAMMPERIVDKDVRSVREKYLTVMEKQPRDLTIYGVANAAFALRSFGRVKAADRFVDFLKDYLVEKPGQGRFFASDAAYYSWMDYRIPTQIAAMKAIRQKNREDACLNDMQLWLMTQKRVQKWDNPMNTIDVVDFLLNNSPQATFHATKAPVLRVDGTPLARIEHGTINTERNQLEGREAQLSLQGNVLADVPAEVIADGVERLDVQKQTPGISWGAAYAVYVDDVTRLGAFSSQELQIQRKLYVQKAGSSEWTAYEEGDSLKVGDKMRIRHIVTADRDMDFVHVTAQHPACLEPMRQLSGYQSLGGRGGYLSIRDSGFEVFFDWFTRGTSTIDMDYYIVREGAYVTGISSVECAYAKQYQNRTDSKKVCVY